MKTAIFIAAFIALANGATYTIEDGRWTMDTSLSTNGNDLVIKITAETVGYVGFAVALTPDAYMESDLIFAGVANGTNYIGDYVGSTIPPKLDAVQNAVLVSASENATHTTVEFTRPLVSGDAEDLDITTGVQSVLWAIGTDDDPMSYHGEENRGSFNITLVS